LLTDLALVLGGFGFAVAAGRRPGWPVLALIILFCSLILLPKSFTHDPNPNHVGIAQSAPALATYSLAVLAVGYVLLLRVLYRPRARSLPVSVFIFIGFLLVGFSTIWRGTDEQISGALQLGLGFCAWFVGGQLGPLVLSKARSVRWLAGTIAGLVSIETLVALLQRAGIRINPMKPALAAIMGDRTNGTTNHPDNLGKVLLLLLILSLGLMGTIDARTRRLLWISVVVMFIPLGLSQGRANILAALTTIVLWALLAGRRRPLAIRIGVPLVAILVILPFAGSIAKRIEEDPNGGGRAGLAAAAYEQIQRQPWGTGPNSYVSVVSAYNYLTSTGYPVHNTFLLTAAELGVFGAILFWLPVLGLIIVAWIARKRPGFEGSFALAIIASAPGLYVVNATGWGLISFFPLPLWFLICGIAYSQFGHCGWHVRAPVVRRRRILAGPRSLPADAAPTPIAVLRTAKS
jgi:O-antigen ligase/polysaccharide polymerase Wzy-like membrane protein